MKLFFFSVGRFLAYLTFSTIGKLSYAISRARDCIYTGFLSKSLYGIGRGSVIAYKIKHHELNNILIGSSTMIESNVELTSWLSKYGNNTDGPNIIIGNNCYIRRNSHITAVNKIVIGNNLLTGPDVLITDNSHGRLCEEQIGVPPIRRPIYSKGPVIIGDNVWLGGKILDNAWRKNRQRSGCCRKRCCHARYSGQLRRSWCASKNHQAS